MGDIRDVHNYLSASILNGLAITAPVSKTIIKAYKFIPRSSMGPLPDVPCAFSTFELRELNFGPAILHKQYTAHIQIAVGEAAVDTDDKADQAAAFLEALITKLASTSTTMTLGGNLKGFIKQLRGASPDTLVTLEWGGVGYVGLDLFLDVDLDQTPGYS